MILAHAFFANGMMDSMQSTLLASLPYFKDNKQHKMVAKVYKNLALVGERTAEPDSSLKYINQCIQYLEVYPDSLTLGEAYTTQGVAYMRQGYHKLAVESLIQALKQLESLGNNNSLGYVTLNLGVGFFEMGRLEESLKYNSASHEYFTKSNNKRAQAQTLNNLAVLYSKQDQYSKSKELHLESIAKANETDQPWTALENMFNMMEQYYLEQNLDSTLYWAHKVDSLASDLAIEYSQGAAHRHRSMIYLDVGQKVKARQWAKKAAPYTKHYGNPQHTIFAFEQMSKIYRALGDLESAIEYKEVSTQLNDSLFTLKKDQQVKELEIIYETEKKDAEIILLNKQKKE